MKNVLIKKTIFFLFFSFLAAIFRLTNLQLIEFKADEALNLYLAARPIFGYPLPPGGTVSSIGLLNPPLFNYLLLPIVFFTFNPKEVTFFIAFINSLTIGFFFLLIKRYFNQTTALIASLIFAFSPWAILFSRKIWPQDLLIPFIVLLLMAFFKILDEQKTKWWWVYSTASLILIQLHQANIIFLLLLSFFLFLKKPRVSFKFLGLGIIVGLLPLIPYLSYLLKNLNDISVFLVKKERFVSEYLPIIFLRPLQILSPGDFHFVLGEDALTFSQKFPLIFNLRKIFYLEYFLVPLGILLFWKKFPRFRPLIYSSLILPPAYFVLHFQPFIHYFIIIMPLLFLFLAAFLDALIKKGGVYRAGVVTFVAILTLASFSYNFAFFTVLSSQNGLKGDYGSAFINIEKENKEKLKKYINDPNYPEMLLASYLNKAFLYGYQPVARMLWSPKKTEKNLAALEERLKQVPEDDRIQNELLAFYTFSKLTPETLVILEQKAVQISGYEMIYKKAVELNRIQNP
jgi:4-amino-4-deoxy-L-arabinose transferase-like glycosyltransferase